MKLIVCIESFLQKDYIEDLNLLLEREDIDKVIFLGGLRRQAEILGVTKEYKVFEANVRKNYADKYEASSCVDINEFLNEFKYEGSKFLLSAGGFEHVQNYVNSAVVTDFKGSLSHREHGRWSEFVDKTIDHLIRQSKARKQAGRPRKDELKICESVYSSESCSFELNGEKHTVKLPEIVPRFGEEGRGREGFTFSYKDDYRIKIWYTSEGQSERGSKEGEYPIALTDSKISKVNALVNKGLDHPQIAFPLATVKNKKNEVVGFVMRNFIDVSHLVINPVIITEKQRIERLEFLTKYMELLIYLASMGITVTDLTNNTMKKIGENAPYLIDIDSVQYGPFSTGVHELISLRDGTVIYPVPYVYRRNKLFYSTAAYSFIFIMLLVGVYTNPFDVFKTVNNRRKSYEEEEREPEVSVDSSPIPNKTLRDFVENVYTNTDENGKVKPVALERVMDLAEQLIREEKGESEATEEAASDEVKDTQANEKDISDTELTLEERLRRWREEKSSSEDADPLRGDALSIGGSEAPVPKPTPAPDASGCTDQGNNTTRRPEIKPGQNTVQGDEGKRPRPQPKPMQKISQNNDSKDSSQNNDSKGSSQKNTVKKPVQKTPQDNDNSKRPEPGHRYDQRTLAARIGNFVKAFIEWLIDRSLSGTLPVGVNTRAQKINYIKTNKTQRNKVIFDGIKFAVTITLPIVLFLLILKFL